jgi:hypothetical protein
MQNTYLYDTHSAEPVDPRLRLAQLRVTLRGIDGQIERLRDEQRFFRKLKFTNEYQQSIMVELLERRRECEAAISAAGHSPSRSHNGLVPSRDRARSPRTTTPSGVQMLLGRLTRALSL